MKPSIQNLEKQPWDVKVNGLSPGSNVFLKWILGRYTLTIIFYWKDIHQTLQKLCIFVYVSISEYFPAVNIIQLNPA